jgi:hypothetical protein
VTNANGVTAGIAGISLTGRPAFTQTRTCGTTLASAASCSIVITFRPPSIGSFSGTLTINDSSGFVHKVPLTGTGASDGGGG